MLRYYAIIASKNLALSSMSFSIWLAYIFKSNGIHQSNFRSIIKI